MNNWNQSTANIGKQIQDQDDRRSIGRRMLGRLKSAVIALVGRYEIPANRVVLPMSSGVAILPNTSAKITSRPQNVAFRPEKILIGGNANDWVVNEIRIGRKSQLVGDGDVPGCMFSTDAVGFGVCFDVVLTAMDFSITVTYVGTNPEGASFSAVVFGEAAVLDSSWATQGSTSSWMRSFLTRAASTVSDLIESPSSAQHRRLRLILPSCCGAKIHPRTSAKITSRPQETFHPEKIAIGGHPERWVINDIKVGNRSQFIQSGDIPGETFAATSINSFVSFETVQTAMDFSILVTYIGDVTDGESFECAVIGSVPIES